jgi:hypothetical protein
MYRLWDVGTAYTAELDIGAHALETNKTSKPILQSISQSLLHATTVQNLYLTSVHELVDNLDEPLYFRGPFADTDPRIPYRIFSY